ncbi:MAG: hypothetical protein KIG65_04740 [Eubacteriales bacterium]|nr:hypothetical protein [Eubacteriales bacterium]
MNAVIDIGTNTIRAVVYDEDMNEMFSQGVVSKLLDYTADGVLTVAGVIWLSNVVGTLSVMAEQFAVKPRAFATSAFRELKNADEVVAYIKDYTGTEITVLSGEEETECDFMSLQRLAKNGVGIDLGGGSCQVIAFDTSEFSGNSYPVGVKRIKNKFVSGILPNRTEMQNIYKYIKQEITINFKSDVLYIFGGTARAIEKLGDKDVISIDDLDRLIALAFDENAENILRQKVKSRVDTVIVGAVIFRAIADAVGVKELKVVNCSVRDGFVLKYCN